MNSLKNDVKTMLDHFKFQVRFKFLKDNIYYKAVLEYI